MQAERQRKLALRWGLVALGAMALVCVRLWASLLEDWFSLTFTVDWRVLSARMSQLKPYPWKAPYIAFYAWALGLLLVGSIAVMLFLGIRDALRSEDQKG